MDRCRKEWDVHVRESVKTYEGQKRVGMRESRRRTNPECQPLPKALEPEGWGLHLQWLPA